LKEDEQMEKGKRKGVLAIVGAVIVLLLVISVSYAYFTASISNTNKQNITVTAGTLSLVLADKDSTSTITGTLGAGDSVTKEFTIENTGSQDVYAKVQWKNLVNTYLLGSMQYTLYESTNGGSTYTEKDSGNIPQSASAANVDMTDSILIPASQKYYYRVTITYVYSATVDQTADLNASLSTGITMVEGSAPATYLADYLKTSVYGSDSTLYLHSNTATGNNETSIANWTDSEAGNANDGAYRYSGSDSSVNNYVCFNYTNVSECSGSSFATSDVAYRIISIEGDNIKLIKAQSLSSAKAWDYDSYTSTSFMSNGQNKKYEVQFLGSEPTPNQTPIPTPDVPPTPEPGYQMPGSNDWTQADINYYLNGTGSGFLSTISSSWRTKIATGKTWHIGGYSTGSVKVKTFYNAEHGTCSSGTCPGTTDTSTIVGLMNVYDYGYAASPTNWNTDTLNNYNNSTISANNWLHRSINSSDEWTITPYSSIAYFVWTVSNNGLVYYYDAYYGLAVRPVLYLDSTVEFDGGSGTSTNPFIIKS